MLVGFPAPPRLLEDVRAADVGSGWEGLGSALGLGTYVALAGAEVAGEGAALEVGSAAVGKAEVREAIAE